MSRVTGKPPTLWRRPMTRTYDCNYSYGENYYKPQLDYIEQRRGRGTSPPTATTHAERLSRFPRSSSATRRAEQASESGKSATSRAEESMSRYASLDDLGFDEDLMRRRRQLLQSSQENLLESPLSPGTRSGRLAFGEKMLDAVGIKESSLYNQESNASTGSRQERMAYLSNLKGSQDALDTILSERKNRKQISFAQSAEADLFTEDPFKSSRLSSKAQAARQEADNMIDDMRKENDSGSSRFRARMRARRDRIRAEDEEDNFQPLKVSTGSSALSSKLSSQQSSGLSSSGMTSSGMSSSLSSGMKMSSSSQSQSATRVSSSTTSKNVGSSTTSAISSSGQQSLGNFLDDDEETAAILSKVEQIRKRAKARLAEISDDFPELQIESALASRRAASKQSLDDDYDSGLSSSRLALNQSGGSSRSMAVSKRTLKSSYDYDYE